MPQPPESIARTPDGKLAGISSLTEMQRAFVNQYLVNGFKETDAARYAGYQYPESEGWRLIRLPHVRAAIQFQQDRVVDRLIGQALDRFSEILSDKTNDKDTRALQVQVGKALFTRQDQRHKQDQDAGGDGGKLPTGKDIDSLKRLVDDWKKERDEQAKMIDLTPEIVEPQAN